MEMIIIHKDGSEINGGIYSGVIEYKAPNGKLIGIIEQGQPPEKGIIKARNILYYIPLRISGKTYNERKNDLRNKAIEYQNSWYDYCGFSYGELSDIQSFFETNGRRYGLLTEFKENCIC